MLNVKEIIQQKAKILQTDLNTNITCFDDECSNVGSASNQHIYFLEYSHCFPSLP